MEPKMTMLNELSSMNWVVAETSSYTTALPDWGIIYHISYMSDWFWINTEDKSKFPKQNLDSHATPISALSLVPLYTHILLRIFTLYSINNNNKPSGLW